MRYLSTVLDDYSRYIMAWRLSLTIEQGEHVAITGPSGGANPPCSRSCSALSSRKGARC